MTLTAFEPKRFDWTNLPPQHVIELEPDSTPEWLERRRLNSAGVKTETYVQYRNGETGMRYWRENGTLSAETITFPDGRLRMEAEFGADGKQIINGRMVRKDGSVAWVAKRDARDFVTTTTYWYNGKTFRTEVRKVGSRKIQQHYYHLNGVLWMHYEGDADKQSLPSTQEVWNPDGIPTFSHLTGLNAASVDTVYRADGSVHFKQHWIMRPRMGPSDGEAHRMLLKTDLFNEDGTRMEYMMSADGYIAERIMRTNTDGTKVEYLLYYDGTVRIKNLMRSDGTITETMVNRRPPFERILMESNLRNNLVDKFDPVVVWQELEDHPEKRPQ
jgi:hypothetical protein